MAATDTRRRVHWPRRQKVVILLIKSKEGVSVAALGLFPITVPLLSTGQVETLPALRCKAMGSYLHNGRQGGISGVWDKKS